MSAPKKIKVGILGLGSAGRLMHVPEISSYPELYEIVAGCDIDPTRRENVDPAMKNAKIYATMEDMLADPEIEMVTTPTRNSDHTPHAISVLEAGKCAVIEKPIAVSYSQALDLKAAADRHPGKLFLRHNRRFEPAFNHVKEIIDSGLIGNVYAVKVHRHPTFARRFDWQTSAACSGGLLNNWGPHLLDQALQLLDAPVADLWCDMQHRVAAGTAEDYFKIMLRGENRRTVDVEVSGNTTLPRDLYYAEGDRGSLVVPLEEKTIRVRHLKPEFKFEPLKANLGNRRTFDYYGNREVLEWVDEELPIGPANGCHSLSQMWPAIYDAIRLGKPYRVKLEEGLEVVRVTEWARNASGFVPCEIPAYF